MPRNSCPSEKHDFSYSILNQRYTVKQEIGCGAFGTVYEGIDEVSGEIVAIKIECKSSQPAGSSRGVSLEYQIGNALNNAGYGPKDGFLNLYYYGEVDSEHIAIVMTKLKETILDYYFRKEGPISAQKLSEFGVQLIQRLEDVHRAGYAHCDLKVNNVMLEGDGKVFFVDFGMAKCVRATNDNPATFDETKLMRSDVKAVLRMLFFLWAGGIINIFSSDGSKDRKSAYEDSIETMKEYDEELRIPVYKHLMDLNELVARTDRNSRPNYDRIRSLLRSIAEI